MKPWIDTFNEMHIPEPMSGCWLWIGALTTTGYGMMTRYQSGGGSFSKRAHRFSWEHFRGLIPNSMCVLHKCDTPTCVNPDHLFLGTQADNMHDMAAKGRAGRGEKACSSKLTAVDIVTIRGARGTQAEIAARFGVTQSHVAAIINRKRWKHVGPVNAMMKEREK